MARRLASCTDEDGFKRALEENSPWGEGAIDTGIIWDICQKYELGDLLGLGHTQPDWVDRQLRWGPDATRPAPADPFWTDDSYAATKAKMGRFYPLFSPIADHAIIFRADRYRTPRCAMLTNPYPFRGIESVIEEAHESRYWSYDGNDFLLPFEEPGAVWSHATVLAERPWYRPAGDSLSFVIIPSDIYEAKARENTGLRTLERMCRGFGKGQAEMDAGAAR